MPARVAKQAWFHRYPRGWPIALLVISAVGTGAIVAAIERADHQASAAELDRNVTEIAAALQRRAAENVALLRAGAALFGSRAAVSPAEFAEFAASLYGQGDFHGGRGMGWAPLMRGADVPGFELGMREHGSPDFRVHPRPPAGQLLAAPVVYATQAGSAPHFAVGFDMFSDPARRAGLLAALRRRQPVATGVTQLFRAPGEPARIGFIIYMPVLRTYGGRRVGTGLVYTPFRADEFLNSAAELFRNRDVELSIYDRQRDPDHLLAFQRVPGETGVSLDRAIPIAGRTWILHVSTKQAHALSTLSLVTMVFGTVTGLLVAFTARLITRRAAEDRQVLELLTRQAAIRTSLTRELNHRVKNTLANVLSIVSLTRRRATDLDEFTASLTARLRALSATHDLLSRSDWTDAPIGEIVRSELAPYMQASEGHVDVGGPEVSLAPNDALSLGLAIHELATNAAKYGGLSTSAGRIAVSWTLASPDLAEIHWREHGGPPVTPPTSRGFGRDLIEKVVAHELRSQVELTFAPEGVECRLRVPVRRSGEFTLRRSAARATAGP